MGKKLLVKKPKYIGLILFFFVSLFALAYLFRSFFIVAVVNGQPLWRWDVDNQLEQTYGGPVVSDSVGDILIAQEAKREGIVISQKELNQKIDEISKQLATQGQTIDNMLAQYGRSKAQFEESLQKQLLSEKLFGPKIHISDKEVQQFIIANASQFPQNLSAQDIDIHVRQQLFQQKLSNLRDAIIQKLEKKAHLYYFIQFPA